MSIGTAKPDEEEQEGIPHHFIDSHSIEDALTAAEFEKQALKKLDTLFQKHQRIVLVGGSGMFIDALCDGLDDLPHSKQVREQLNSEFQDQGLEPLLKELGEKDHEYYEKIDRQNPVRVIRALEVIRLSGRKYSELRAQKSNPRPFQIRRFVIDLPREELYQRIDLRVDVMMERGLLEEVKRLLPYQHQMIMRTVGYQELFPYLNGKTDLESALAKMKQNSRRYAKRQLTWFRRNPKNVWLKSHSTEKQLEEIEKILAQEKKNV